MTEIEKACEHALVLFTDHCTKYPAEIVVEPLAWRRRCRDLAEDYAWLLFCKNNQLPPNKRLTTPPMPPLLK